MLGTVTPLGERARGNRYPVTAWFLVGGAVLGGSLLGVLAWALTSALGVDPSPSDAVAVLLVAAVLAVLVDLRPGAAEHLGLKRQVNDKWVYQYKGWAYGLGFGVQLGAGVLTVVSSAQIVLALVAASLAPTLVSAAFIGGLIGLTRGAPVLLTRRVSSTDELMELGRRVEAARLAGHRTVVLGGALVAILLAMSTLGRSVG